MHKRAKSSMESVYIRSLLFVLHICKSYEKYRLTKLFGISAFPCIRLCVAGPLFGVPDLQSTG